MLVMGALLGVSRPHHPPPGWPLPDRLNFLKACSCACARARVCARVGLFVIKQLIAPGS